MTLARYLVPALVGSLWTAQLGAQDTTGTITGRVVDSTTQQPLPGVNIVILGTQRRTLTGSGGEFLLSGVAAGVHRLRATRIGYAPQEQDVTVTAGATAALEFPLVARAALLEEVVVTGYGEQRTRDVTGVVQEVGSDVFNRGSIVSPDQLIAGKIAGVQITPNTGEPGGQSFIRIRGGTSINAGNEPLFVIDGVPVDNSPHNPGALSAGRNPLNFINPNDIESFTILKDASATAIYGSRAANGVILITTKRPRERTAGRVTYDTWVSIAQSIDQVDVLNAAEFRQAVSDRAPSRLGLLSSASTDWQSEVLRTAIGQNHALSFSGGGENNAYRASLGHLDQEGIVEASKTQRTSVGLSYTHRLLDDHLAIDANVKAAQTTDRFAPGGTVGNAVSFAPTQPIEDPASPWGGYWEWTQNLGTKNPVAEYRLSEESGKSFRGLGNVQFDYQLPFIRGLSTKLNLGFDVSTGERERFAPSNLRSQFTDNGEVRQANFTRTSTLLDAYVNYVRQFDDIDSRIDFTGGYSYQDWSGRFPEFRAWNFLLGSGSTVPTREQSTSISEVDNRLISFFGRVNYALKDRYLLTFTIRRDGSSRFGPANRWGTFPSAAVAWRLGDEDFLRDFSVLSELKLRAGWGITGNQEIGDFRYLRTFTIGDNQALYQFGDEFVATLRPNGVDSTLKWEETKSYNIGLDYGLFQGRVTGSLDYYWKRTDDLLFEVTVPAGSNLTDIILTNIGSVENRGFEFAINSSVVSKPDVSWNLGFNLATNRNEILKLTTFENPNFRGFATGGIGGGVGNTVQILRVGYPAYSFLVFRHKRGPDGKPLADGVDHNGDGTVNDADIYQDANGDGRVTDLDRVPYQSPAPDVILGLTSLFQYKALDVSFTLRGHFGNYVYNNVASNFGNYSRVISDLVPQNIHRSVLETNFLEPQLHSDYFVEDASFVRMDNLTVGYTVRGLSRFVNSLRVYGTVQNVFTVTGYSGLDPEIGNISGQSGNPRIGIDDSIYPRARTFIFGVSFDL